MRLKGKVSLITGGASGIGRATALLFAKEGAKVVIADINESKGESVVQEIKKIGAEVTFVKTDVSKASDVKEMVSQAIKTFGKIDILFNNAGIPSHYTKVSEMAEETWDKMLDINLKGVFLGCKYAIPEMKKNGGGSIINTSSGVEGAAGHAHYSSAKGGVTQLTKSLALELAKDNIRVNCIRPGVIETPMSPEFWKGVKEPEKARREYIKHGTPMGRAGKPEEVAQAVLFLASNEASYVSGISLFVDGGSSGKK